MKLPQIPEEFLEFYPAMSAQNHEAHIKEYARKVAIQARSQAFEDAEKAVHSCASLDENGYICEKSAAIQAIRQHSQKGEDNADDN